MNKAIRIITISMLLLFVANAKSVFLLVNDHTDKGVVLEFDSRHLFLPPSFFYPIRTKPEFFKTVPKSIVPLSLATIKRGTNEEEENEWFKKQFKPGGKLKIELEGADAPNTLTIIRFGKYNNKGYKILTTTELIKDDWHVLMKALDDFNDIIIRPSDFTKIFKNYTEAADRIKFLENFNEKYGKYFGGELPVGFLIDAIREHPDYQEMATLEIEKKDLEERIEYIKQKGPGHAKNGEKTKIELKLKAIKDIPKFFIRQ